MQPHRSVGVRLGNGAEFEASQFADSIHLEGAEALATFTSGIFAGQPAATSNRFGKGRAIHLGGRWPLRHLRSLFSNLIEEQNIRRVLPGELPSGVYATRRHSDSGDAVFLMNFGERPANVRLDQSVKGLPDGQALKESVTLPAFGLRIFQLPA